MEDFWIGRYEAGIEGSITDLTKSRTMPTPHQQKSYQLLEQIKAEKLSTTINAFAKSNKSKNAIPYNWVTCSEAQSLAKEMTPNSNYTSSLMFGIQWDLVCKYLEEKGGLSVSDIKQIVVVGGIIVMLK